MGERTRDTKRFWSKCGGGGVEKCGLELFFILDCRKGDEGVTSPAVSVKI